MKSKYTAVCALLASCLFLPNSRLLAESYDLTINFTGMTPHLSQKLALRVVDSLSGKNVADTTITALETANFSLMFEEVLMEGSSYYVDFYADLNKNGTYDAPSADHAWRLMIPAVSESISLNFQHNTTFTNVMYPADLGPFDLSLNFIGMTPHVGQMLQLRVVDSLTSYVAADTTIDALATADFMLDLPGVLQVGRSYYIDFYADFNKNGIYDAPPADHAWRLMVSGVNDKQTWDFTHNTSFTDIMYPANPGPFDLVVNFTGMIPHLGQMFSLRVVDSLTGMSVGDTMISALDTADFTIELEDVLMTSSSYYVDFYADFNGNGMYDAPPADHAWRLMASMVSGIARLSFTHNTTFTDVMFPAAGGPFDLTVDFVGMTPHLGNKFELRVVDMATGYEVGETTIRSIPSANFQVMLPMALQAGRSYNVDFYADLNKNGMYDDPPADHAWRMTTESVADDVMLTFTHNVSFTDIMYPTMSCGCDLNHDGMADMADLVEWGMIHMLDLAYVEACLDRNGDGMVKINDAILLLIDIRMGNCSEMMEQMLASARQEVSGSRHLENLSREQIAYLEDLMVQLKLTPEEQQAYLLAIHGSAGKASLPRAFALAQNFPNPFNPSTTISYSVPEGNTEQVSLKVYDLRGRLVKTLVTGAREAGNYNVFWDGTLESGGKAASGVYFYRLSAGDFTQTRKLVLLK